MVGVCCVFVTALIAVSIAAYQDRINHDLTGTFSGEIAVSPLTYEYLTFYNDGTFFLYRQNEVPRKGICEHGEDGVLMLNFEAGEPQAVVYSQGKIYRMIASDVIVTYEKVLDRPILINPLPLAGTGSDG